MENNENQLTTEENMTKPKAKETETLICPECLKAGKKITYADRRALGRHRQAAHGIAGTSSASVAYRAQRDAAAQRKANTPAKGVSHPKNAALIPVTSETAGIVVKPAEISVAILGYAMGRLEALAEQIARENGLPEKEFVKQTAANLAALTRR